MTYAELLIEARQHISSNIVNYRPACGMFVEGMDDHEQIPRAIVCWLENGSQIIYINNDKGERQKMSDLISRNKAISVLEQLNEHSLNGKMDISNAIYLLKNQQTAYSVDKVIEELEAKENEAILKAPNTSDITNPEYQKWMMKSYGFKEAIEIVKQGGVDDDCCEWRIVDRPNNFPIYNTSCGKIRLQYSTGIDVYCNGCGKKIKVVE